MRNHLEKSWSLKLRAVFFSLLVLILLNAHYYSDFQTNLLPGIYVQDGPSDLKAGKWSVPLVFDWNDDGKKDLLVGSSDTGENGTSSGHVYFYKNSGSDSAPSFSGHTLIQTCADMCSPLDAPAFG